MEKIQNLLNQVSIIIKKNDELLDATSGRFNVFSLCKVDHYEPIHSKIIAEFLNPKGSHGFGNQFLDAFMEIIREGNGDIKDFRLKDNAKVKTEHGEGVDGFIDILISDEENAVIIENKIYATDQGKQLIRYNKFAKDKYKKSIILYLTLDGSCPSKDSSEGVEYTTISYKVTITKWLERCIQIAALRPIVRETLLQYINHINNLTGDNIESKFKNELINICSKQENIEATFAIFKSQNIKLQNEELINNFSEQEQDDIAASSIFKLQDRIKNNIIVTHLIPQLKKIAEERDLKFWYEGFKSTNYREKYNKNLYFKKWKYVELWFQFQNYYNDLGYGIRCIENNKEELLKVKKIEDAFNALEKDKGEKWCSFKYMTTKYRNWNYEAFIDMENGELSKEIAKVIDEVLEIVYGLDL